MLIQNPDAAQIIRDNAKLTLTEGFPQNLLPNVQPVMDMTPRFHQLLRLEQAASATSTSSSTLFTASTSRKTFIVAVAMSYVKDAACDAGNGTFGIRANVGGVSKQILSVYNLTLTAQQGNVFYSCDKPILIDKGAIVQYFSPTYTAGSIGRTYCVYYYETD